MDSNGGRKWESYSMDPNREWVKFYKQYKMMIIIINNNQENKNTYTLSHSLNLAENSMKMYR